MGHKPTNYNTSLKITMLVYNLVHTCFLLICKFKIVDIYLKVERLALEN